MALLAVLATVLGLQLVAFTDFDATTRTEVAPPAGQVAPGARRPTLTLRETRPLLVAGHGFVAGERVRVSVQGRTRQARAERSGRFSVQFADVNPCNGGTIVARGSVGSRAVLAIGQISNVHCL